MLCYAVGSFTKMQIFWLLTLGCLAATAFEGDKNDTRVHGENGWFVPYVNGTTKWFGNREAKVLLGEMKATEYSNNPVQFYLLTKSKPQFRNGEWITGTTESITAANFNPDHPTRFIIHGWMQSYRSDMNKLIINAWHSLGEYNIIIVDWRRARSPLYFRSVEAVPGVGAQLAQLIDFLVTNYYMSLETLHLIGFSLGAHVAGYAGKYVKTGQIQTIIGLDPALPLFSFNKAARRLCSTDAFYVEIIHTNGGQLGFQKPLGKADFYPNGGVSQPGCSFDITGYCSHLRAPTYYAKAVINQNFAAVSCENYKYAVARNCGDQFSLVCMAADLNPYVAEGAYYVPVE